MYRFFGDVAGIPLRSYGFALSSAVILACIAMYYFMKREHPGWEKHVYNIGLICGIAGVAGARLWDVFFFEWAYYSNHLPEIMNVWQGGLSIQGGIAGGIIAAIVYTRANRINTLEFLDIASPAIILGQAIGRCANFLNGDSFGKPTGGNFGILYPENTVAHLMYGVQPLWPVEVWEGQLDVVIFVLLLAHRTMNPRKGQSICLYVMLYSAMRFFIEYLRYDYQAVGFGIQSAQLIAAVSFIAAAVFFICIQMRKKQEKAGRNSCSSAAGE